MPNTRGGHNNQMLGFFPICNKQKGLNKRGLRNHLKGQSAKLINEVGLIN